MANKGSENLKKYETSIRNHVECEEKAFHIVNNLIDGKVDGPYLMKCGQLISREHYHDVVEERAISFLCGYPLCDNSLTNIPKKQYHISTSTNKVYDISERKNFCSNQCLKASKHFSNQIPESPLWTRAKGPSVDFKLIPHTETRGMVGSEVIGISPQKFLEEEIKNLEKLDIRSSPLSKNESHNKTKLSFNCRRTTPAAAAKDNDAKKCQTSVRDKEKKQSDHKTDNPPPQNTIKYHEHGKFLELGQENVATVDINSKKDSPSEPRKGDIGESSVPDKKVQWATNESTDSSKVVSNIGEKLDEANLKIGSSRLSLSKTMHQESRSETNQEQTTRLEHLMKLLSKRKNVLTGMIDDVTTVADDNLNTAQVTSQKAALSNEEIVLSEKGTNKSLLCQPSSNLSTPYSDLAQPSPDFNSPRASAVKHSSKNVRPKKKPTPKSVLEHIGVILKTWVTAETTAYLQSSLVGSGSSDDYPTRFLDPRVQQGYAELCQRLDAQQKDFEDLISDTGDQQDDGHGKASKSLPDYSVLKKEAELFQLKVTEFITGKKPQLENKKEDDEEKDPIHIPTVDTYDQRQIRIKIVLDRLDKFLPDLLAPLHLSVQDVSYLIREFVYTCRLEKHNIVFKPSEWTLVAIFILKMLGKKNKNIAAAFSDQSAIRHFSTLLKGIGHTADDLDTITEDILSS